jgi:hypothetical protein
VWWAVQKSCEIPLESAEFSQRDKVDDALKHYQKFVDKNHGINRVKLRQLLLPLGFQENDLDRHDELANRLESIADNRNPAAHRAVNRAKQYQEPVVEWNTISGLYPLLDDLDADFDAVCVR